MTRTIRRLLPITVVFLLLTAGSPARAGELMLEASAGGQHSYSSSFDAFGTGSTPNVYASGGLTVGYGLDELLGMPGISVIATVGRNAAGTTRFDDAYQFRWHRAHYLLGAEFSRGFGPGSWVQPFVRLSAGLGRQRVAVTPAGGPTFSQYRSPFEFSSRAGLELHTPFGDGDGDSRPTFSLGEHVAVGGSLQIGYLWQPPATFDALRVPASEGEGGGTWRRTGLDVGRLDANGWSWAIGISTRFRL